MAKKEKNTKNKKILLIVGFAILGLGLLIFGGALLAGLITLGRDLLLTALALDTLLVGGVLGKKAVDGISNAVSKRKAKNLQKQRTKQKTKSKAFKSAHTELGCL